MAADIVEERVDPVITSVYELAKYLILNDLAGGKIKEDSRVGRDNPRRIPSI